MTNQTQNLFIIEENPQNSLHLHRFLEKKFGTIYSIFSYTNVEKALSNVDKNTVIVVLNFDYFGKKGIKIVNSIRHLNKKTEVIILSNNEEIGRAIETFKNKTDKYLVKQNGVKEKLNATIFDKIAYPAKYFQQKYSVSQAFVYSVFLFIIISIIVFIGMKIL
jgi:DNA-binding NarL/FixJ family response regulator